VIPSKTFNPMPALEQPFDHDDHLNFARLRLLCRQIVWTADPDGGWILQTAWWLMNSRFTLEQSKGSGWA